MSQSEKSVQHSTNLIMKKHNKVGYRAILLFISFLLTGCAAGNAYKISKNASQGRYDTAVNDFETQKTAEQATLSELFYLARSHYRLHDYSSFETCADLFLKRYEERFNALLPHTKEEALSIVFAMKAKVLLDFGKYGEAQEMAQKAEALIPDFYFRLSYQHYFKNIVEVYETAGLVQALSGNRGKAKAYIEKLDELSYWTAQDKQLFKKVAWNHRITHRITLIKDRHNLYDISFYDNKVTAMAKIHFANKSYADAKAILEEDLKINYSNLIAGGFGKIAEKLNEKFRKEELYINYSKLFMLAKSRFETGDTSEAKQGYDSLLKTPEVKNMGDLYWVSLLDLGRIHAREGNRKKALELFETAAQVIETQRSTINSEAGKIGFVGDKQAVYFHIIKTLFEEGRYDRAFEFIERSKARALVDLLASKSNFTSGLTDEVGIDALLNELNHAERASIMIAYGSTPSSSGLNTRAVTIEKITAASPELTSLITVESIGAKRLQALIPTGETVIEYYAYKDNWYAVIATRDSIEGIILDCAGIDQDVADFRDALYKSALNIRGIKLKTVQPTQTETRDIAPYDLKSRRLCKKILDPLEEKIPTRKVTIVPHGALHYLPFGALLTESGYLIERYNIRVLPSVSVLKFLAQRMDRKIGDLFIVGNPDLGDPKYDLPFAQEEALVLKNMVADSTVLLRDRATESAIKKYGSQFTKIHVACHGVFSADDALHSGLLLSADEENDGRLTVSELYDMRLNASIVTLSACETALGKVSNGDDVVGFTRGFLFAGAQSIVSSLWKVDDRATSLLMQEFYRNLSETDKRTALRKAQLAIKNKYHPHPFFWAAFQITGAVQ